MKLETAIKVMAISCICSIVGLKLEVVLGRRMADEDRRHNAAMVKILSERIAECDLRLDLQNQSIASLQKSAHNFQPPVDSVLGETNGVWLYTRITATNAASLPRTTK